jgi:diguanylate cyclase (GGDEF)-like protein
VRAGEVCARLGGDEFAVLLPNTPLAGARVLCGALEEVIAGVRLAPQPFLHVCGSAGCAELGAEGDAATLVRAADAALYARKQERRGVRHTVPG